MSSSGKIKKRLRPVYNLRDEKGFDHFIKSSRMVVVVVYHYICPGCERYLPIYKDLAAEYTGEKDLVFGKIHMQLEWMIRDAELVGDVEEENVFLRKYDVGQKVPATMFFVDGTLKWKIEGLLTPPVFRGLISKLKNAGTGTVTN